MPKVYAPFTDEQVELLKAWQEGRVTMRAEVGTETVIAFNVTPHPFTCCSYEGCKRREKPNEGALMPSTDGWICPCGKYTQDWAHDFMVE